jgi:hypothetical protein
MSIEKLNTEYSNLLKKFETFLIQYAKDNYNIKEWLEIAEYDENGVELKEKFYKANKTIGNLPYLDNIKLNIEWLKFILFDILNAISGCNDGLIQSFYRPQYLTELWYYKAFNIIVDLESLKIRNINREDPEVVNITHIRNNMIEHFYNKGKNRNQNLVIFEISIEKVDVKTKCVINKNGKQINSLSLIENNIKLLNYLMHRLA